MPAGKNKGGYRGARPAERVYDSHHRPRLRVMPTAHEATDRSAKLDGSLTGDTRTVQAQHHKQGSKASSRNKTLRTQTMQKRSTHGKGGSTNTKSIKRRKK